jgi:hypothetical protein
MPGDARPAQLIDAVPVLESGGRWRRRSGRIGREWRGGAAAPRLRSGRQRDSVSSACHAVSDKRREQPMRRVIDRLIAKFIAIFVVSSEKVLRRFIHRRWPQLTTRIPEGVEYLDEFRLTMLTSDTEAPLWKWIYTRGGIEFLGLAVPDPYFACGCQNRGNADWLLAMWRAGSRRFWFSEMYVVIVGSEDYSDRVSRHLSVALARWDRGDDMVMYSDQWGWLGASGRGFERDVENAGAVEVATQCEDGLRAIHAEKWKKPVDI